MPGQIVLPLRARLEDAEACWFGIVCFGTATYAGDAIARALPLVSPFGGPDAASHDWASILGHFGALQHTGRVAAAWEWAGRISMSGGIVFGSWVLWIMHEEKQP